MDEDEIGADLIERWALHYLGRYASSAEHLRRVLLRRAIRRLGRGPKIEAAAAIIDGLLGRYRTAGLIDDAAYAVARAQHGLARGRSLRQIGAALAAKGVGLGDANAALATLRQAAADPELAAACALARRRRLGPFRRGPADPGARQRELGVFARAGFPRAAAEAVLACQDEAAVAALLSGD